MISYLKIRKVFSYSFWVLLINDPNFFKLSILIAETCIPFIRGMLTESTFGEERE